MNRTFCACRMLAAMALGGVLMPTPSFAQKAAPGTIKGELTVNSQIFPLRYVYAVDLDKSVDYKTMADVNGDTGFALVMSDQPIPPAAVGSAALLKDLALAGKLNGIMLSFESGGKMSGGHFYYGMAAGKHPGLDLSFGSDDKTYTFPVLDIMPNRVLGTATMPSKSMITGTAKNGTTTYQYNAKFTAKIVHRPYVTAILTGDAARNSPQMQTVFALNAAYAKGDMTTAQRYQTPAMNQDMETTSAQMGRDKMLDLLKALSSDKATTLQHLSRIVVRGNLAMVVYDNKDFILSQLLRKVNGVWLGDMR